MYDRERIDALEAQISRLATFIIENFPGEPSQSQGAIDTAIRLLGDHLACQKQSTNTGEVPQ